MVNWLLVPDYFFLGGLYLVQLFQRGSLRLLRIVFLVVNYIFYILLHYHVKTASC